MAGQCYEGLEGSGVCYATVYCLACQALLIGFHIIVTPDGGGRGGGGGHMAVFLPNPQHDPPPSPKWVSQGLVGNCFPCTQLTD